MSTQTKTPGIDLLLVDDDEDFRNMTARNNRKRGHQVQESGSAEAALKVIVNRDFDVAVVDLNMPGMSGIELLEALKKMGSDAEVVMLTGEATVKTAELTPNNGANKRNRVAKRD